MTMVASKVAAAGAAATFASMASAAAAHRGHVFLVGQDSAALERMRKTLGQQGYRVYVFIDIQVFLNFVTPVSPAVLVLDVALLGTTGTQMQERLKSLGLNMPVIWVRPEDASPTAAAPHPGGVALAEGEAPRLQLLQQGHSNQDIAKALGVSQTTAARHKSSVLLKLNLRNIADWPYR